jgi:hypothetical protein
VGAALPPGGTSDESDLVGQPSSHSGSSVCEVGVLRSISHVTPGISVFCTGCSIGIHHRAVHVAVGAAPERRLRSGGRSSTKRDMARLASLRTGRDVAAVSTSVA